MRPEFWKTVGEKGTYVSFITYYHHTMKLPARGDAFRKKYMAEFKEEPTYSSFNGYTQVMLIADAVTAAKSDRGDDIVKALTSTKFDGWNGTITFTRGDGPYWQQWTPPMLIVQYTKPEQPYTDVKIVFPLEFKTGDWMPAPNR